MGPENNDLDKYINDLSDITDDTSADTSADTVEDTTDDNTGVDAGREPVAAADEQNVDASAQPESVDPNAQQQKPKDKAAKGKQSGEGKKAPTQEQLRPLGDGAFADAQGNIVDSQGKLIAKGGFAARMYQSNRRLKAMLDDRTSQLNEVARAVGEVRALAQSIQSAGLDNNDMARAIDIASRIKRGDAVGAAKEVLAIIAAQGYNVTDLLGPEVGDSIELRAVRQMIDERLAPVTRQEQARQATSEAAQRGRQQYERFIADNEYADVHADDIVKVMQREGVNPQTAYNRIMMFAAQNGLDPSQPLKPQLLHRMQQAQSRQTHQQRQQTKPMPNGAATTRTAGAVPSVPLANADDDWGTIIRGVQSTMGVQ